MLIKKNVLILHLMDRGGLWMDSKSYLERWLRSWFGETLVVNG